MSTVTEIASRTLRNPVESLKSQAPFHSGIECSRGAWIEAPRSKLRGITELNFEDCWEAEANPIASYVAYSSSKRLSIKVWSGSMELMN
jgi:hypothetical protein